MSTIEQERPPRPPWNPPPSPPARPPQAPGPSPAVRTAWIAVGAIVAFVVLGWGTAQTVSVMSREQSAELRRFDATRIDRVQIDNRAGSVRVQVGPSGEVTVDERIDEGLQGPERSVGVFDATLVVRASCEGVWTVWCGVDHTVTVPAGTEVQVFADDGSVTVEGDLGRISVVAGDGDVDIGVPGDRPYQLDVAAVEHTPTIEVATDPAASDRIDVRADEGRVTIRPLP